eukprot:819125-Pyramimonas_sp.AAC.1
MALRHSGTAFGFPGMLITSVHPRMPATWRTQGRPPQSPYKNDQECSKSNWLKLFVTCHKLLRSPETHQQRGTR